MNIHDLARKFLSEKPGLNMSDAKKKAVFEFSDWLHEGGYPKQSTNPNDGEMMKIILENAKNGKVTFMTFEGGMVMDLKDFISQPAEGILYDLNRDQVTTMTIMPELRWINDMAVAYTIEALKSAFESK